MMVSGIMGIFGMNLTFVDNEVTLKLPTQGTSNLSHTSHPITKVLTYAGVAPCCLDRGKTMGCFDSRGCSNVHYVHYALCLPLWHVNKGAVNIMVLYYTKMAHSSLNGVEWIVLVQQCDSGFCYGSFSCPYYGR